MNTPNIHSYLPPSNTSSQKRKLRILSIDNLKRLHQAGLKNAEVFDQQLNEIVDKLIAHHHIPMRTREKTIDFRSTQRLAS